MVEGAGYIILVAAAAIVAMIAAIYWIDRSFEKDQRDESEAPPLNLEQRARNASDD
jgi:hypothetical protein